ncbi:MAG: serine/threonine-protein phosphatase [Flavobacteriales bacterium]|nr:serine/threonine-protein phosphatase [Flavobacteriales bacterium]
MVFYLPIEIIFNSTELVPYIILETSVLALTLFFNYKKWFRCTRIYFFFASLVSVLPMMYFVPVGAGHEFLLLPIAILPALLFHNKTLGFVMFTLVLVVFFVVLNTREMVDDIIQATPEQLAFFRNIYLAMVFVLTFTIAFYFRTIVNDFENIIKTKNFLLKKSNEEISLQKTEIETAHGEIKASISYAKRIQEAILPSDNFLNKILPNSFVYYRPKDIVAGDFYWLQEVDDHILFSAADCTGHGVPGAMVSVVCNNSMNQAVKEFGIRQPSLILEKTRELVIETFSKSIDNVQDGMDLALCSLNLNTKVLQYAGAHNPLWIIRKDSDEIEEVKADKLPVGNYAHMTSFTNHHIQLHEGDAIYLFSDGYVDQFGGEKGKKFKTTQFKSLLLSIRGLSMDEQKDALDAAFISWKGNLEQVDDVCIIGVKV